MSYWNFINFFRDWRDAIWSLFETWFIDCPTLQRRLHFLETGVDEERKKHLPYRIITFMYRLNINSK